MANNNKLMSLLESFTLQASKQAAVNEATLSPATEGARSAENTSDVKKQNSGPTVDETPEINSVPAAGLKTPANHIGVDSDETGKGVPSTKPVNNDPTAKEGQAKFAKATTNDLIDGANDILARAAIFGKQAQEQKKAEMGNNTGNMAPDGGKQKKVNADKGKDTTVATDATNKVEDKLVAKAASDMPPALEAAIAKKKQSDVKTGVNSDTDNKATDDVSTEPSDKEASVTVKKAELDALRFQSNQFQELAGYLSGLNYVGSLSKQASKNQDHEKIAAAASQLVKVAEAECARIFDTANQDSNDVIEFLLRKQADGMPMDPSMLEQAVPPEAMGAGAGAGAGGPPPEMGGGAPGAEGGIPPELLQALVQAIQSGEITPEMLQELAGGAGGGEGGGDPIAAATGTGGGDPIDDARGAASGAPSDESEGAKEESKSEGEGESEGTSGTEAENKPEEDEPEEKSNKEASARNRVLQAAKQLQKKNS